MKRGITPLLTILFLLSLLPLASAGILISQPDNQYNIGEALSVDITLTPTAPANDFLTVDLTCNDEHHEIYRNPFNLAAGESVTIEVFVVLSPILTGGLLGDSCELTATYDGDSVASQQFEVSNQINIDLDITTTKYDPGQEITINGFALRKSGSPINGFVEASIQNLSVIASKPVNEEAFSINFTIPQDATPGTHDLSIRVYEEDLGDVIKNEGVEIQPIEITQLLTEVEVSVGSQTILPGETLTYSIDAYDQADLPITDEASLTIYDPDNIILTNQIITTGEDQTINIETHYKPGYWKIEALIEEQNVKKLFYVEEVEQIQTTLLEDTLLVNNIGNTEYNGPIEIGIGSSEQVKQLRLDVGETQKFRLHAPDGTYSVSVNDGKENVNFGNVPLTGNAISVEDVREGVYISFSQPLLWVLAIILLVLIMVFVQLKKTQLHKKLASKATNKIKPAAPKVKATTSTGAVMYGRKEEATIIALRIGEQNPGRYATATIEKALTSATHSKAKVYIDGEYRIMLFAPSLTKVTNNEIVAVRTAKKVEEIILEHNKIYKDKLKFGIGVHTGTIISEIKNKQFTFTTVGNVISKAKRIAQSMDREALLSETTKTRLHSEIKTERISGKDAWKVTRVTDRSKHQDFLQRFSKGETK